MSDDITVALIAAGASVVGSGVVTLLVQRLLERRIATSRAIGEQFAKERFETIQRLGSLLRRVEQGAREQIQARLAASYATPPVVDTQSRLLEAIENYESHEEADPGTSPSKPYGNLANYDAVASTQEGQGESSAASTSMQPATRTATQSALLGWLHSSWSRIVNRNGKQSLPAELTPQMLDSFLYVWRPLNEAEAELDAEIRNALDEAYLFLSPKVVKRFERLLPRSLRGDAKASAKLRTLLREAMEGAHRK